jgi:hypothetical protein
LTPVPQSQNTPGEPTPIHSPEPPRLFLWLFSVLSATPVDRKSPMHGAPEGVPGSGKYAKTGCAEIASPAFAGTGCAALRAMTYPPAVGHCERGWPSAAIYRDRLGTCATQSGRRRHATEPRRRSGWDPKRDVSRLGTRPILRKAEAEYPRFLSCAGAASDHKMAPPGGPPPIQKWPRPAPSRTVRLSSTMLLAQSGKSQRVYEK